MATYAKIREALMSPVCLATTLGVILRKQYGEEVYDWDLTTIYLELRDDFKVEASTEVMDRIGALQTVMTSDAFFRSLQAFMPVCNTLNGGTPGFEVFDPVTPEEAAWAIAETSFNRNMLPFAYPVKKYMRIQLDADGYKDDYPDVFDLVFADKGTKVLAEVAELRAGNSKVSNIEEYLVGQTEDLFYQLDQLGEAEEFERLFRNLQRDDIVTSL